MVKKIAVAFVIFFLCLQLILISNCWEQQCLKDKSHRLTIHFENFLTGMVLSNFPIKRLSLNQMPTKEANGNLARAVSNKSVALRIKPHLWNVALTGLSQPPYISVSHLIIGASSFIGHSFTKSSNSIASLEHVLYTYNYLDQDIILDYGTKLRNRNGMTTSFAYHNGSLLVYNSLWINGSTLLLDSETINSYPRFYIPSSIYSSGDQFLITSFNDSKVKLRVSNNCVEDRVPSCTIIPSNIDSDYYTAEAGKLKYYLDKDLFASIELKDEFLDKVTTMDNESINFLLNQLGIFPPVDKVILIKRYGSESYGSSTGFYIITNLDSQMTQHIIDNIQSGNTHELVHVFLYGLPAIRSWFEEGIADYMMYAKDGALGNTKCYANSWADGYHNSHGDFVAMTPSVPYSDFNVPPQDTDNFYDPLTKHSYYRSAMCFWIYINDTYGSDAISEIAHVWIDLRTVLPPEKKWLVKDIVNPTLNANLSQLIYDRYSYVEG